MSGAAVILPGARLGVLGGGQLGRMFALAAAQLGYKVVAFTPEQDSPVSQVCEATIVAPFEDKTALQKFAGMVAATTIEFENIPAAALATVQASIPVRPGPQVLHITQHRQREKSWLQQQGFPVVPFVIIDSLADLQNGLAKLGVPAVLKTAGFGYDGKGQQLIAAMDESEAAYEPFQGNQAVLEQFVAFTKEISVIGARSGNGEFSAFGPIENEHRHHILDLSFVPAAVSNAVAQQALEITRAIMVALDVVGLLCVEFFLLPEDKLLINELAPRPHNSGHYSIEGCATSQFEQQVRCLTGLPLGVTRPLRAVAMTNLLGDIWSGGEPCWQKALAMPDMHLHLYGKTAARAGRKMGHLTACADSVELAVANARNARLSLMRAADDGN